MGLLRSALKERIFGEDKVSLFLMANEWMNLGSNEMFVQHRANFGRPMTYDFGGAKWLTHNHLLFVQASLEESIALQESHLREGNVYLPVASFASDLYFTISDLTKLNNLYRISLSAFMRLFQKSLEKAPHGGTSSDKVRYIDGSCAVDPVNYSLVIPSK